MSLFLDWRPPSQENNCPTCLGEGECGVGSEGGPVRCPDCYGIGQRVAVAPRVLSAPPSAIHAGHWYISAKTVARFNYYLHRDGVWRRSTDHNDVFSGYYASEEEALALLQR